MKPSDKLDVIYTVIFSLLLIFCTTDSSDERSSDMLIRQAPTIIEGQILSTSSNRLYYLRNRLGIYDIQIDSDRFYVELSLGEASIMDLELDQNVSLSIYAKPGDSLGLILDTYDIINGINENIYRGDNSEENTILFNLNSILKYDDPSEYMFYNCSESEFGKKIDSLYFTGRTLIDQYLRASTGVNEIFTEMIDQYLRYKINLYIEEYPNVNKLGFRKERTAPINYDYKEIHKQDINEERLLNNIAFLDYIETKLFNSRQLISSQRKNNANISTDLSVNEIYSTIDSLFQSPDIREYLRYRFLLKQIEQSDREVYHHIESFKKDKPNPSYVDQLENKYSLLISRFSETIIIPDYELEGPSGNIVSLSSYRGRILYIDFWATWCGPCLAQKKYFEAVRTKFLNEKDVEFIEISLDDKKDKQKWIRFLKERNYQGMQLIAENGLKSKVCLDFNIKTIPRYVLVGRDGEIIDYDAMMPSHNGIVSMLEQLLYDK